LKPGNKVNDFDLYTTIRSEIVANHALMHWFTLVTAITLLASVWIIEHRRTILSLFVPLLSLAWAAAMVRFDFFIHRQAAYLRSLESRLQETGAMPLWETWKAKSRSTQFVVPLLDIIAVTVIVLPTLYLLFGPAREYCRTKQWRWATIYAWAVSIMLVGLLLSLAVIPKIAAY
jgi:hypothetical protein